MITYEYEFYLQHGTHSEGNFLTERVEYKEKLLPYQQTGLMYTASGYGKKIPTSYMIKYNNRWHRVYSCIFSNSGTNYIIVKGERITVTLY